MIKDYAPCGVFLNRVRVVEDPSLVFVFAKKINHLLVLFQHPVEPTRVAGVLGEQGATPIASITLRGRRGLDGRARGV